MDLPSSYLKLITKNIDDSLSNAEVKIESHDDTSFTVYHPLTNTRRTILKTDDPNIESYSFISAPRKSVFTSTSFNHLQDSTEDMDDTNIIREQLRLEEQFGSYSRLTREQSLYLLGTFCNHPKSIAILASPSPSIPLEEFDSHTDISLLQNPLVRSRRYIPAYDITFSSTNNPNIDLEDPLIKDRYKPFYKEHGWIDKTRSSYYYNTLLSNTLEIPAITEETNYIDYISHPFNYYNISNETMGTIAPTPKLLYDVRLEKVSKYSSIRIKTCMKQDPLSRSRVFDDVNIPIFATPISYPMTKHPFGQLTPKKLIKVQLGSYQYPLLQSPQSYTLHPHVDINQLGIVLSNPLKEEYIRHYVTPSLNSYDTETNSFDTQIFDSLQNGIDIDSYPSKKGIASIKKHESGFKSYISMQHPEVFQRSQHTKQELTILNWVFDTMPEYAPIAKVYKKTSQPKVWFEIIKELYSLEFMDKKSYKLQVLSAIADDLQLPYAKPTIEQIRKHVNTLLKSVEDERIAAENANEICYGLSIRKLYTSIDTFKQDATSEELYWDSNRDPLDRDIQLIQKLKPELLVAKNEDDIATFLTNHYSLLSGYEIKRRAFELTQDSHKTRIRPNDLIMVRLPNATYIYQKTSDGWVSKSSNLNEQEYCLTNAKGYSSLTTEQLMGKQALKDGCSYIDSKCVPNIVKKWIDMITLLDSILHKLNTLDTLDKDVHSRSHKIKLILHRLIGYTRILPSDAKLTFENDAWKQRQTELLSKETTHYESVLSQYETARQNTDFTSCWNEIEAILDTYTVFSEDKRAYVEKQTHRMVACEHVSYCISAAKSTKEDAGAIMKEMIHTYGNQDEVGQRSVCRLCGEVIGEDIIADQEGYGQDDALIQVRTVVETASDESYKSLPLPAQALYQSVLQLRNNTGLKINESELVRACNTIFYKYMIQDDSKFIAIIQHLSERLIKQLRREIGKQILKQKIKKNSKAKNIAKKIRIVEENRFKKFVSIIPSIVSKADTSEETMTLLANYSQLFETEIPTSLKTQIESYYSSVQTSAYTIITLLYAVQSSPDITEVGLMSVPGITAISQRTLYYSDPENMLKYLSYIYSTKARVHPEKKDTIDTLSKQIYMNQLLQDEAIKHLISTTCDTHNTSLDAKHEHIITTRIFTPELQPYKEAYIGSFKTDHPFVQVLNDYKGLGETNTDVEQLNPNMWMNYNLKDSYRTEATPFVYDTQALELLQSRFPLSMARLESMRDVANIKALEEEIIAFARQYDLDTGLVRRKMPLRTVKHDTSITKARLLEQVKESIPSILLDGNDEWLDNWINQYMKQNTEFIIEYDIKQQKTLTEIEDDIKRVLSQWKEEYGEEAYRQKLLQYRDTIRGNVTQHLKQSMTNISKPKYEPFELFGQSRDSLPTWYQNWRQFTDEQIVDDMERITNFLTQTNLNQAQKDFTLTGLRDVLYKGYSNEFIGIMNNLYMDSKIANVKREGSVKTTIDHDSGLSDGSELRVIEQQHLLSEDREYNRKVFEEFIPTISSITQKTIEDRTAEVLAQQNRARKERAEQFTEEETGIQKIFREFQLGKKFVSSFEMGIDATDAPQEYEEMYFQQQNMAELSAETGIGDEELQELMMGMGEDEGQYDDDEYESL